MTIRVGSDASERKVLADVEEYGWHCLNIHAEGDSAPWTFTIGLYKTWKFPELIIVGLKQDVAHAVLNNVAVDLKKGIKPDLASPTGDLLENYMCCYIEVPKSQYREHVGTARWYYGGNDFPLFQIVWPSKDGHFPWHPDASESFRKWQSLLGLAPVGA
jgi:hypothetical protein